ncbi:helix-turn-helix transcriptional regulator [Dasania marina]|uniref:helix-turn-helix transcriptional regulator n=1 Tax=Dasania marina TaxID=471499 RepID=UPI0030D9C95A
MNQQELTNCIQYLGEDDFYRYLFSALNNISPVDLPIVWLFKPGSLPITLYHNLDKNEESAHIDDYRDGEYEKDPVYQSSKKKQHDSVYRLTEISQNNISQKEYMRNYFNELAVHDEVGYVVNLPEGGYINFSLSRRNNLAPFTQQDVEKFREAEPVVRNLIIKHWQMTQNERESHFETQENIQQALQVFGSSVLTNREQEVLHKLLHGHSNQSAADTLFVSLETLRRHRKHIYQKLGINSQAELFSLFIHSLPHISLNPNEDPLPQKKDGKI